MHIDTMLVPIVGIMLPMVLVPTIMTLKFRARKRELEHKERMRALETGQSIPGQNHWPAALVCTAIGAGVPAMAFVFTFLTERPSDFSEELWSPQSIVAIVGVVAGSRLAYRLMGRPNVEVHRNQAVPTQQKSYVADPDAFDVVGRRG